MQLSNTRLNESVIELLERLRIRTDLPADAVYDLTIAAAALSHTRQVDKSDGANVRDYAARVAALARTIAEDPRAGITRPSLLSVAVAADNLSASTQQGNTAKQALSCLLDETEAQFTAMSRAAPKAALDLFSAHTLGLLALHNSMPLFGEERGAGDHQVAAGEPLTEAVLANYFRETLSDPSATVSSVVALPGGFGKETVLFTLASKSLNADLVIRRDPPIDPLVGLDCHSAATEYPLLRAVHARGFPAPEPLFFEDGTKHIRGPAFTIMRRAPGKGTGNAMGGTEQVPLHLQTTLAQIVARLHDVPPLNELANNPMFAADLWTRSATECTRGYIAAWHRQFTASDHIAAPVLQGLLHWLLANVPPSDAPSTLIHGDIGFHNLLFENDVLTAVLDWEFGHVGDPAEDLGYIRSVMGKSLDWNHFLTAYTAGGRPVPEERRIHFFEIWSHARNAAASAMMISHFEAGRFRDVKFAMLALRYIPHFLTSAEALIHAYEKDFGKS